MAADFSFQQAPTMNTPPAKQPNQSASQSGY